MARPKEFDVDDALQNALDVFWRKGYEATSVHDLVEAMGIQRASLYGTFGDKHTLYLKALSQYQQAGVASLSARLLAADSPRQAILDLLAEVASDRSGRAGRRGCFCVNAGIELAPHDKAVAKILQRHTEAVEQLFVDALRRAKQMGEVSADLDEQELATFLFGVLISINVLGKMRSPQRSTPRSSPPRASQDRLQAMVRQATALLSLHSGQI